MLWDSTDIDEQWWIMIEPRMGSYSEKKRDDIGYNVCMS